MMRSTVATLALAGLLAACGASPHGASPSTVPAAAATVSVGRPGESLVSQHAAVAADHPAASRIGAEVLARGGNAADAAVATALALGVVNPFASGLGGGGLAVTSFEAGRVEILNFRERAPACATPERYASAPADASRVGGLAVAIPSELAGLRELHRRFGRLPWGDVVEPAARLAEAGFEVTDLYRDRVSRMRPGSLGPEFDALYAPPATGLRQNPALARTLRALAGDGEASTASEDYGGHIVAAVTAAGGCLTLDDMARPDLALWQQPLAFDWHDLRVFSAGLPSAGGYVVAQTLGLVGGIEVDPSTAAGAHRWAWSMAHAFADRAVLGDTDRSRALLPRLLSPARALELKASFSPDSMGPAERFGAHWVPDDHGTSHLSVVDAEGHAVALTTTINGNFGSWVVVPELGIVLNNEIDDFVTRPGTANLFGLVGSEDNLVAPGKQPLSSMSPTLVFDETGLLGAVGGSGGPRIASGVALVLGALGRGADPGTAVAAPRLHHQWMPFAVAIEPGLEPLEASLRAAGHEVRVEPFVSAIQAIWRGTDGGWLSGSDPRKGGAPAGF